MSLLSQNSHVVPPVHMNWPIPLSIKWSKKKNRSYVTGRSETEHAQDDVSIFSTPCFETSHDSVQNYPFLTPMGNSFF